MEILRLLFVLALAAVGIYVLAILLRVAAHFCGAEIPALGRAFFATFAVAALSLLALLGLQLLLTGGSDDVHPGMMLLLLVLGLPIHAAIAAGVYKPALGVRLGLAFRVWAVQGVVFIGVLLVAGCCLGGLSRL